VGHGQYYLEPFPFHRGQVFDQPAECRLGRNVPPADLLVRQAGQLALQHVTVQLEKRLKYLALTAGAHQLIRRERRIRLEGGHAETVVAPPITWRD